MIVFQCETKKLHKITIGGSDWVCNLKTNQQANVVIKIDHNYNNINAFISPFSNTYNNYNDNLILDDEKPFVLMIVNKFNNNIFNNCTQYFKNYFNIKV